MALNLNVPIRFVYVFYFKWFRLFFYGFVLVFFFLGVFFVILNGVSLRERLWICLCLIVCFLLFFFCFWNIWFFK